MKVLCSQLGGPCDQAVEGDSPKDIFARVFMHIKESGDKDHQELFKEMENMSDEECEKWNDSICNLCQPPKK